MKPLRIPLGEAPSTELASASGGSAAAHHLGDACRWLSAYFHGSSAPAPFALDLSGLRPFQLRVYEELLRVRFGDIVTYGKLARLLDLDAGASRAVGRAVGANPLPIVIPCHRVVRADGRLGGFSGGLGRKATLLRLEGIDVEGEREESRVVPGALRLDL